MGRGSVPPPENHRSLNLCYKLRVRGFKFLHVNNMK